MLNEDKIESKRVKKSDMINQRVSRYQQHVKASRAIEIKDNNSTVISKLDTSSIAEKLKNSLSTSSREGTPALIKLSRSATPTPLLAAVAANEPNRSGMKSRSPERIDEDDPGKQDTTSSRGSKRSVNKSSVEETNKPLCPSLIKRLSFEYKQKPKKSVTESTSRPANIEEISLTKQRKFIAQYLNGILSEENDGRPVKVEMKDSYEEPEPDYWDASESIAVGNDNQTSKLDSKPPFVPKKPAISLAECIVQSISLTSGSNGSVKDKKRITSEKIFHQESPKITG